VSVGQRNLIIRFLIEKIEYNNKEGAILYSHHHHASFLAFSYHHHAAGENIFHVHTKMMKV